MVTGFGATLQEFLSRATAADRWSPASGPRHVQSAELEQQQQGHVQTAELERVVAVVAAAAATATAAAIVVVILQGITSYINLQTHCTHFTRMYIKLQTIYNTDPKPHTPNLRLQTPTQRIRGLPLVGFREFFSV